MNRSSSTCLAAAVAIALSQGASAGTDVFFNPLTHSASVASPNHVNELNSPWVVPAGISQENLMSMNEVEADVTQSVLRVPAGTSSAMFDMIAYDPSGKFLFIPHETPFGAGLSRYDIDNDETTVIFAGDELGSVGDWSSDYAAFDPARWTPNGTVLLGEEWSGEGRAIEILNPMTNPQEIQYRELESIANVAHEGIAFSKQYDDVIYYVDEWRSGAVYKFVMKTPGDYTAGQTFVLAVDAYNGDPADYYSDPSNVNEPRTGAATWVPLTDVDGNPLTQTSPFRNGPTNDPRSNNDTRGGRVAADEAGATPYGRPEDMEIGTLANGNEVIYFTATSETSLYGVEITGESKAFVRLFASADTAKNVGFAPTTGVLNSPDNLAQDALGNIYVIEDAPNSSDVGGDIWFVRDTDNNGVAESLDHMMSLQVDGAEATGMIFNPVEPTQFVVSVQHPDSTDLVNVPDGFGDAVWSFDVTNVVAPPCAKNGKRAGGVKTCSDAEDSNFVKKLASAE